MKLSKALFNISTSPVHVVGKYFTNGHFLVLRERIENGATLTAEQISSMFGCGSGEMEQKSVDAVLKGYPKSPVEFKRTGVFAEAHKNMIAIYRSDDGAYVCFNDKYLKALGNPEVLFMKDNISAAFLNKDECLMPMRWDVPAWFKTAEDRKMADKAEAELGDLKRQIKSLKADHAAIANGAAVPAK